ncbi:MAG: OmpA family protein [Saprospiraceae bacterium]|nr:OmpA family protein [Saprospiraceae bacterium]
MRIYLFFALVLSLLWISCTFTRKVQTGMQAYEVKQFSVATQLFEAEYAASKSQQDKAQLAYYAGESFSNLNDPASAATWYFKAHQDGFGPEALDRYADALKQQEKYPEAIQAYEDLLKASPGNAAYRSNITLCKQAIEWKRNKNAAYEISQVNFNTTAADYAPVPIGPGILLFTSDRDSKETTDSYLWTGRSFSDLYVFKKSTQEVSPYDEVINSPDNEGTAILSPDGQMLVFTRCYSGQEYDAWCKLMFSYKRGNGWLEPEPFPFIREEVNFGHPAFAANGTTLFFSSDAPEGQGGHDIYFTQIDAAGKWAEPVNLGSFINTVGQEQYPTVYKDTLFYSSDRLAGLGGLDIFKTYLDQQGQWVPPINLRSPINSGADDFGLIVDTFATPAENVLLQGFLTSSRGGAARNDDIFAFTLKGIAPTDVAEVPKNEVPKEKPIDYQLFLSLRVMEPQFEVPDDPNSTRVGKKALPNGPIIITQGLSDQRFVTDELGQFLIKLEWNKQYTFTARYRDHLAATYSLNTGDIERNPEKPITTINQIMELDPIFRNMEIVLENIFYDYDQWAIRDDAKPSLNNLSIILKNNPTIRIQLSSYTDCRGTDEYNLDLSQKRAQSAIEYLMSVGIPAKRLVAQGFGESNLSVNCVCEECSEEQHQANRLTTFKIID